MTGPLEHAKRHDPQNHRVVGASPPSARSRKAIIFSTAAAEGRFRLQQCGACGFVCYPPREICPKCWCMELPWVDMPEGGTLLTESTLHTSVNTYFRDRMPWRIGTIRLDAGAVVLAHVHGQVPERARVRMIARTDKSGQGVLMALPVKETWNMADDRQLRTLTCDPKNRRVLITDGRTEVGQSMARAISDAGAATIYLGIADGGRPYPGRDAMECVSGLVFMPLDLSDSKSVGNLAKAIGEKVDILINTAEHVRSGGSMEPADVVAAQEEMEINYFGLLRLIQTFGPAMRSRGGESENGACAWVNLFSVYALSNLPAFGTTSASQAAAYSLNQCFRAEMAGSGVKVVNILLGPLDEAGRQSLPPPKVSPQQLAKSVVEALQQGIENVTLGAIAEDIVRRFREDPMVLERELMQTQRG